jgi:hypothetical protein
VRAQYADTCDGPGLRIKWSVDILRIESVEDPFTTPEAGTAASRLLGRAETMGFLSELGTVSRLDRALIAKVLQRLGHVGLVQHAIMQGGVVDLPADPDRLLQLLEEATAALEDSPIPDQEWAGLRDTLGDELLARLCRISEVSLRRYAAGTRTTPDAVAQRLHTLGLIVADLRGAYNDYGIRRWFQRPRAQLGGRTAEDFLPVDWTPDSPEVTTLRKLAGALSGSPAT